MSPTLLHVVAIIGGFIALAWSADRLVESACALARHWSMPSFAIGVIILGFGTSLPELLVSAAAAARGSGGIAIGNAFGSNIANLAMILGISALIAPLFADRLLLRRDLPLILFSSAGVFMALSDLALSRIEGVAMLITLILVIGWTVRSGKASAPIIDAPDTMGVPFAAALTVISLLALSASAWVLVWGCSELARTFGVSELLIGLTLVAIGTSLPELAASVASLRRAEGSGLILGNVVGSNLFNTLGVVGLPAVIRPFVVDGALFEDSIIMLALTAGLGMLLLLRSPLCLTRSGAIMLLLCYIGYLGWNAQRMMMPT